MAEREHKPKITDPTANLDIPTQEAVEELADAILGDLSVQEAMSLIAESSLPLGEPERLECIKLLSGIKAVAPAPGQSPLLQQIDGELVKVNVWFGNELCETSAIHLMVNRHNDESLFPGCFVLRDLNIALVREQGKTDAAVYLSGAGIRLEFEELTAGATYEFVECRPSSWD